MIPVRKSLRSLRSQAGITLIELLIGMVISLFLLFSITSFFQQSKNTYAFQQSQANQQQHERILSVLMGTMLRHAGYAPMDATRILGRGELFPVAGGFVAAQFIVGTDATHAVSVNGMAGLQNFPDDSISVRYVGDSGIARCNGTVAALDALVVDRLSTDGVRLTCTADGVDVVLFGLVDVPLNQQLRVLGLDITYGEDTNGDDAVDSLVSAAAVADWAAVLTADIEVFFQAGSRPAQASGFTVTFENALGVDQL